MGDSMKKRKGVKALLAIVALTGALTVGENALTSTVPHTNDDLENTKAFVSVLNDVRNTDKTLLNDDEEFLEFASKLGIDLDKENIEDITSLTLDYSTNVNDYKYLKYFTNLETLRIKNTIIDLSTLEYNQKLKDLTITGCNIKNTNHLPNSITSLSILNTIVDDKLLYLPYNTKFFSCYQGAFTNIKPKNPKVLSYLSIDSNLCLIDLAFLDECSNLLNITINTCPNIINGDALTRLNSICKVHLDDYSTIWLTTKEFDSIKNLDMEDKEEIREEIEYLDKLAIRLVPNLNVTDYEKIKAISDFIITNLSYSKDISEFSENFSEVSSELNDNPIRTALSLDNSYDEICINYACLFQALANRTNLVSTQLMSVEHTWNEVNDKYIDLTTLDATKFVTTDGLVFSFEDLLESTFEIKEEYYYAQNPNDIAYNEVNPFDLNVNVDNNIGYLEKQTKSTLEYFMQYSRNTLLASTFVTLLVLINEIYDYIKYNKLEKDINKRIKEMRKK